MSTRRSHAADAASVTSSSIRVWCRLPCPAVLQPHQGLPRMPAAHVTSVSIFWRQIHGSFLDISGGLAQTDGQGFASLSSRHDRQSCTYW